MANNENSNLGKAAAGLLVAAIGGLFYLIGSGLTKAVRKINGMRKVNELVRKGLADGLTDAQIVQAFYDDAEKQFGRPLTAAERGKIEAIFFKEKARVQKRRTYN